MRFLSYLKSQWLFLFIQIVLITYIGVFTYIISFNTVNVILTMVLAFMLDTLYLIINHHQKDKFYKSAKTLLNSIEEIRYSSTILEEPTTFEEKILFEYIDKLCNYINKEANLYKTNELEYREYLEIWLHEIKIPISCLDLICENTKNELTRKVLKENKQIYSLVEQALYYSKVNYIETDITIKECNIDEIVNDCLKSNSYELIAAKTEIQKNNTEAIVYSDYKWLYFIINQIISNSIKYRKDSLKLSINGQQKNLSFILTITDNGMGICSEDLPRVFEKGFTGKNGHQGYKSTGIGLYLIAKMAKKLNITLSINSKENEFTSLILLFPADTVLKKVTKM